MKFYITNDDIGICIWSEKAKLSLNGDARKIYSDDNCQERGVDNLYDFIEDILGIENFTSGEKSTVTIQGWDRNIPSKEN